MTEILILSITVRIIAVFLSVKFIYDTRNWKLSFLTIMLFLMALRQSLTLYHVLNDSASLELIDQESRELPGLIVSFIALFTVYFINKLFEELETSKQKLTQSLYEKEILLKELHHRVKNNLQLVSSI